MLCIKNVIQVQFWPITVRECLNRHVVRMVVLCYRVVLLVAAVSLLAPVLYPGVSPFNKRDQTPNFE